MPPQCNGIAIGLFFSFPNVDFVSGWVVGVACVGSQRWSHSLQILINTHS